MNIRWTSKNPKTLKQYLEVKQYSRNLIASFLLSRRTQELKSAQDRSTSFDTQDDQYKVDLLIENFGEKNPEFNEIYTSSLKLLSASFKSTNKKLVSKVKRI